jgi:hypothetical protein
MHKITDLNFIIPVTILLAFVFTGAFFICAKPRLKILNKCFFCHSKQNLICIKHPGYDTTYHYYHNECLKKVLNEPENYPEYVDTAIQIQDQINQDILVIQAKAHRAREQIRIAKTMATPLQVFSSENPEATEPRHKTKNIEWGGVLAKPVENISANPKLLSRYTILKKKR